MNLYIAKSFGLKQRQGSLAMMLFWVWVGLAGWQAGRLAYHLKIFRLGSVFSSDRYSVT